MPTVLGMFSVALHKKLGGCKPSRTGTTCINGVHMQRHKQASQCMLLCCQDGTARWSLLYRRQPHMSTPCLLNTSIVLHRDNTRAGKTGNMHVSNGISLILVSQQKHHREGHTATSAVRCVPSYSHGMMPNRHVRCIRCATCWVPPGQ